MIKVTRKQILLTLIAAIALILVINYQETHKIKGMKVVDNFYLLYNNNDYNGIGNLFHIKTFSNEASKQQFIDILTKTKGLMGNANTHKLNRWEIRKNKQIDVDIGKGNFISLQYAVKYSNYPSADTFEIFNPEGTSEYKIIAYNLNSPEAG